MRSVTSLPGRMLGTAIALGLGVIAAVLMIALGQPWLGMEVRYKGGAAEVMKSEGPTAGIPEGSAIVGLSSDGKRITFSAEDFVTEPDGAMGSYENYESFLSRQGMIAEILRTPTVQVHGKDGEVWEVQPLNGRPLGSLPVEFWVQVAVGLLAWIIAAGVWVFRPREAAARYLLLSGWSTLVFAPLAGVYTTRELALPEATFRWLSDLNFLGGSVFAGTMVALLLCYPKRLATAWLGVSVVVVQILWFAAQQMGVMESMTLARRLLVMVYLGVTFLLAWVQWRKTRRDPIGRAALRWFLLSWLLGSGLFCLLILLPQMFGVDTSAVQGFGFLLFLLVYGGLAFGILRFRLFGLDEWWLRVVTWMGALMVLVSLDLLFVLKLHWSAGLSLSLSLVICGLIWLPLRGYLSGRLMGVSRIDRRHAFKRVLYVGLASTLQERDRLWQKCLVECFDPLRTSFDKNSEKEPELKDDGLALVIPEVRGMRGLRLEYARGGRSLFTYRDLGSAKELVEMLEHVISSRTAYERGVEVERKRIARDIHDNLGSQILGALHSQDGERRNELLREMLNDLRSIINDASSPQSSIQDSLAELRFELGERLDSCGVDLHWEVDVETDEVKLPDSLAYAIRPLLREATGNILKHASATRVDVRLQLHEGTLGVEVLDDGVGFEPSKTNKGHGLVNMRARVAQLGGTLTIGPNRGKRGTHLSVLLPISQQQERLCAGS